MSPNTCLLHILTGYRVCLLRVSPSSPQQRRGARQPPQPGSEPCGRSEEQHSSRHFTARPAWSGPVAEPGYKRPPRGDCRARRVPGAGRTLLRTPHRRQCAVRQPSTTEAAGTDGISRPSPSLSTAWGPPAPPTHTHTLPTGAAGCPGWAGTSSRHPASPPPLSSLADARNGMSKKPLQRPRSHPRGWGGSTAHSSPLLLPHLAGRPRRHSGGRRSAAPPGCSALPACGAPHPQLRVKQWLRNQTSPSLPPSHPQPLTCCRERPHSDPGDGDDASPGTELCQVLLQEPTALVLL